MRLQLNSWRSRSLFHPLSGIHCCTWHAETTPKTSVPKGWQPSKALMDPCRRTELPDMAFWNPNWLTAASSAWSVHWRPWRDWSCAMARSREDLEKPYLARNSNIVVLAAAFIPDTRTSSNFYTSAKFTRTMRRKTISPTTRRWRRTALARSFLQTWTNSSFI